MCKSISWWFEPVKENITVTLTDITLGLLNRTDITNYLIILGKLHTFGNAQKLASSLILIFFLDK